MSFIRIKTCCELLNVNCDQGRKCPVRLHQHNSNGSDSDLPIVMFESPWQWLQDVIYTGIYAVGIVAAVVVLAGFAGYFWGKHV